MTFENAYAQYYKFVLKNFRYYSPQMAEEYAQDVFKLVYENFDKYDSQYKMSSFIFGYVKNVHYDIKKHNSHKNRGVAKFLYIDSDEERNFDIADEASLKPIDKCEERQDALSVLQRTSLSKVERQIMKLMIDDHCIDSISEITGQKREYVKRASYAALKKLSAKYAFDEQQFIHRKLQSVG